MKFPTDIKGCMKDCILSIIWPRKDIIRFFEEHGCTKSDLKQVTNFEHTDISRSGIIDGVFDSLNQRPDGGLGQYRAMLHALIRWTHFDSYYFEKLGRLDRPTAERHLTHLRQLQEIRDAKLKDDRTRQSEIDSRARETSATIELARETYLSLFSTKLSSQKRGYALEAVLRDLARLSQLETTEPFRTGSEQIDGAVKFDGEHYLLEAKWHDARASNEALYQMSGKILGKMYGRGVFISINGFSKEAVSDLTRGKVINMVLVDGGDLTHIVEGRLTFAEMLDRKVNAAQTRGQIYIDPIARQQKEGVDI